MLTQLFSSVFTSSTVNVSIWQLGLCFAVSLLLGLLLAGIYKYKASYTKEFVVTLTLLPSLIAVIIFLTNGSLGTSVAVAGTFSLVRFRSAAGSSKELLAVFMATAIGLATGMGHLALAIAVTLILGGVILLLEQTRFVQVSQHQRYLLIGIAKDFDYQDFFERQLGKTCQQADLLSVQYKSKKNLLVLEYQVLLDSTVTDKELMDRLLVAGPVSVNLHRQVPKKKYL
ncbi:DUF4956 domain-containing protein [Streptococcus azizii]|uniref:DUF4956 domain-containing protein n=1 Tax=Streptococcus azizii TaxID=1579424 RepID=A0AB36JQT4_9STRE|nr:MULTISPECIES: DUF4956 domain-containing protein [Streptococcus]MBF0775865.1 DUF4956 domain-containing protein [Streptococcus sp. 19428wD3_AN2]ONK27447.1 DUF4956 domain-containing protein [Streptococcus azizii]ONK28684.1 DUF4956 domain-containing protein [Streptococcus azizii]ONK29380.1 DUF4956 domain-containing protein [Streptococcus azizii]TFU83914.1 DUF4956 domain-containing protein [Streptococcus sp. AN2]